jgi:hypothetical protein
VFAETGTGLLTVEDCCRQMPHISTEQVDFSLRAVTCHTI